MAGFRAFVSLGRSRRTETALLLAFIVLALVIGSGAWRSIAQAQRFHRGVRIGHTITRCIVEGLRGVPFGDVLRAESEQRGYLVTGDALFLATYDTAIMQVRGAIDRLLQFTEHDARLRAQVAELKAISEKRFEYLSSGDSPPSHGAGGPGQRVREARPAAQHRHPHALRSAAVAIPDRALGGA